MDYSIPLVRIDDFTVIGGSKPDPAAAAGREAVMRHTREVLDGAGNFIPSGRLSGSFICAHPCDYHGRPALDFSVEDWRGVFREFKELGIDTAIWQGSALMELRECYYPSTVFNNYKQWNVIEPMLQAAADEHMKIYLGSFCVLKGEPSLGVLDADPQKAVQAADRELACTRELINLYRGGFQGYYLSTETFYAPSRAPLAYKHYGIFFERVTHGVKELLPDIEILASPSSIGAQGHEQEAVDRLMECFGRAQVDVFAPQDCIGQLHELGKLTDDLKVWRTIAGQTGAAFWVNCESFLVTDYQREVMTIEAADPRRFLYQMTVADQLGARKLVTWEAMHFLDPHGPDKSRALRRAILSHHRQLATSSRS